MSGIFSCFTRQSSVDTLQVFQHSIDKANKDGRVSSSNLHNLLKSVKNSPEPLTLKQYRKIQDIVGSLDSLLANQHSNLHAEKSTKITEAYKQASQNLNPDARIARTIEAKQAYTNMIDQGLENIKQALPGLESRVQNASYKVDSTIAQLPTLKAQQEARRIISSEHFSAFGKDTAITSNLFPSSTKKVETLNGNRYQKFEAPGKSTWTSLEDLGKKEAIARTALNKAKTFQNHRDNFTFNKPDNTGKLELTAHQQNLLNFAQGK